MMPSIDLFTGVAVKREHEALLNTALDQLFLRGSVSILWEELYYWYGAERLGRRSFRDIIERWEALCEECGYGSEIPGLEVLESSDTWLHLRRSEFSDEKLVSLAEWA